MKKFLAVAAICVLNSGPALAEIPPETDREVQYLLAFVANSGCDFERNGSTHDPADAADHLRLKYRRGARYVDTAEHFIDRLASESSWTGRDYSATCNGKEIPTGQWLHQALDDYRATPDADSSQP
ncbi:MAG: DUF5329 domain-containing protein [Halioglobus sp.]